MLREAPSLPDINRRRGECLLSGEMLMRGGGAPSACSVSVENDVRTRVR
jgi:hypothetical protein